MPFPHGKTALASSTKICSILYMFDSSAFFGVKQVKRIALRVL